MRNVKQILAENKELKKKITLKEDTIAMLDIDLYSNKKYIRILENKINEMGIEISMLKNCGNCGNRKGINHILKFGECGKCYHNSEWEMRR